MILNIIAALHCGKYLTIALFCAFLSFSLVLRLVVWCVRDDHHFFWLASPCQLGRNHSGAHNAAASGASRPWLKWRQQNYRNNKITRCAFCRHSRAKCTSINKMNAAIKKRASPAHFLRISRPGAWARAFFVHRHTTLSQWCMKFFNES
jgi:hypothetical protein